ncbi:predicted protein [Plenodomus lingam JN3]|uniref:Predicted protein n=1 Tax=Leptosphaeria maculans (strain JN3 / isolate v23.1.3 / race Av1-4-5-6-7-8) TaxID=985895 RepID=E5A387_LEPMJ|nr:predicted protein [Plenodomus lingam JN3]CBX98100.1 predicted protein [Plenodomus lingam JN3]
MAGECAVLGYGGHGTGRCTSSLARRQICARVHVGGPCSLKPDARSANSEDDDSERMSSGNPFRASQLYTRDGPSPSLAYTDSGVSEAQRGNSDYVLGDSVSPPPPKFKTKKQVRIVSPTVSIPPHPEAGDDDHAADDVDGAFQQDVYVDRSYQDSYQDSYTGSLPSIAAIGSSTNASSPQGDLKSQSTWEGNNMAAISISPAPAAHVGRRQSTLSPTGVPANPFSRTLASLEPQTQETASADDGRTGTEKQTTSNKRATLDVESFKNLLLTGKPTPRPSAQSPQTSVAPNTLSAPQLESGSSTDTSSISRQSLYESAQETHQETPRTSYEMPESEEDESMGLVSEVKKGKKKPPPAPKHRHGKLVTPRQPQVVSFDSFMATEPAPVPTPRSRNNSDHATSTTKIE